MEADLEELDDAKLVNKYMKVSWKHFELVVISNRIYF